MTKKKKKISTRSASLLLNVAQLRTDRVEAPWVSRELLHQPVVSFEDIFSPRRSLVHELYRQFHIPGKFYDQEFVSLLVETCWHSSNSWQNAKSSCGEKRGFCHHPAQQCSVQKSRKPKLFSPMALCKDYVWMKSFTKCRPDWRLLNKKKKKGYEDQKTVLWSEKWAAVF